jgi:hypothetical protein
LLHPAQVGALDEIKNFQGVVPDCDPFAVTIVTNLLALKTEFGGFA